MHSYQKHAIPSEKIAPNTFATHVAGDLLTKVWMVLVPADKKYTFFKLRQF
jgi:hypothetical protein